MTGYRFPAQVNRLIEQALEEDLGWGDITTQALVPPDWVGRGKVVFREAGIVAGLDVMAAVFTKLDPSLDVEAQVEEGDEVEVDQVVAAVSGPLASILSGERLALNFLQRLSAIATETARYVKAIEGLPTRIVDTRKTTPGMRWLEKYAVRVGGGHNHRMNLGDGILIKDNHLAALGAQGQSLKDAVAELRRVAPHPLRVEVEVESVAQAQEALEAGADVILLDNMSLEAMRKTVELARGRVLTEASGGIRLETVRAVAETGVDLISVGALTHSVRALDISLELD